MACPFLAEVRMVFCRAYPVKLLATDRLSATGLCCGECFEGCAAYQEYERAARASDDVKVHAAATAGGKP